MFRLACPLLAPIALVFGGCQTTYTADIRNNAPQPIYAELVKAGGPGHSRVLSRERIGPGDRGGIHSADIPQDWPIYVQIDAVNNPGYPQQLNLAPGVTIITVTQDGTGAAARLRIESQSRP
jgi:hypothetical protein